MAKDPDLSFILEDLRPLAVEITRLELLPGNPNLGDVEAVMASYTTFGQRKPIVVRRNPEDPEKGTVLAGNTQLKAARRLGWTHLAVTWTDDDDRTAAAFALADNRTADLGKMDNDALLAMLESVTDVPDLFSATGYDLLDVQDLIDGIGQVEDGVLDYDRDDEFLDLTGRTGSDRNDDAPEREHGGGGRPVIQYALVFSDEVQQRRFYDFIKVLKKRYPDEDTVADRLDLFLQDLEADE